MGFSLIFWDRKFAASSLLVMLH